jgi:hypothetical protein
MKHTNRRAVLVILALLMFGVACGDGGSGDEGGGCKDACDRAEECGVPGLDGCGDFCDDLDDQIEDFNGSCVEAIGDLFACGAELDCDDIEQLEGIFDLDPTGLTVCEDEIDTIRDECADEFDNGDDEAPS